MARWHTILASVMEERGGRLVAYATLLVGTDSAEDLVQDALIRSFSRGRNFDHINAAEAYVRRVMATMSIDAKRSRVSRSRSRAKHAALLATSPTAPDVESALDVRAALAELSPRIRACVVLRYYDDLTAAQIAQTLGLAPGTVKRNLHDAAVALRSVLGEDPSLPDSALETVPIVETSYERNRS